MTSIRGANCLTNPAGDNDAGSTTRFARLRSTSNIYFFRDIDPDSSLTPASIFQQLPLSGGGMQASLSLIGGGIFAEIMGIRLPGASVLLDANRDGDLVIDDNDTYTPGYSVPSLDPDAVSPVIRDEPGGTQDMDLIARIPGATASDRISFKIDRSINGKDKLGGTPRTSSWRGYCGNATATNFDNGPNDPDFVLLDGSTEVLERVVPFDATGTARVPIRCKDYGGFTTIKIDATIRGTGRHVGEKRIPIDYGIRGGYAKDLLGADGRPQSLKYAIRLPSGPQVLIESPRLGDRPMNFEEARRFDGEADPFGRDQSKFRGDGLTALEEYRGFLIGGQHRRTHWRVKDVFVALEDTFFDGDSAGLSTARMRTLGRRFDSPPRPLDSDVRAFPTPLVHIMSNVHRTDPLTASPYAEVNRIELVNRPVAPGSPEVRTSPAATIESMVINSNNLELAGTKYFAQRAILLLKEARNPAASDPDALDFYGLTLTPDANHPSMPSKTYSIAIYAEQIADLVADSVPDRTTILGPIYSYFAAHELGHAVHLAHYTILRDTGPSIMLTGLRKPTIVSMPPGTFDDEDRRQMELQDRVLDTVGLRE